MKAIEAAEHSNVIYNPVQQVVFVKIDGKWVDDDHDEFQIHQLQSGDYIPLVPKKIYKVGDKVTFLEALNSGMCFKIGKSTAKIQNNRCYFWATDHWSYVGWGLNEVLDETCTLCEDPSIQPKPTLESLPAWTRCKVKPVNYTVGVWDVIKKPSGALMHYGSGGDFDWVNVKLISVYNPKTEQWEDV